jgi:hypothetical protein
MELEKINLEWGNKFIETLNKQEAAIVFAFGLTKDGKVKVCTTTDLTPEQLDEKLKGIIGVTSVKTELSIKQLTNGPISCEMQGEEGDVAQMLCKAMIGSTEVAAIVCGAVPTYLDVMKIDRAGYCKTVMDAVGAKE